MTGDSRCTLRGGKAAQNIIRRGMRKKMTIVIIDDEQNVCLAVKRGLEQAGNFTVYEAKSAAKGFALACEIVPDVILLDMMMPGMNGAECRKLLREAPLTEHIPVIYLTGLLSKSDGKAFDGMIDGERYLAKPACINGIIATVDLAMVGSR